ncbi:MAG TPA: phage baseplate assembly protein V [Rubrivivax sp.]|nr:phage baseplate assembly protein V [Rubrivivax sp.]
MPQTVEHALEQLTRDVRGRYYGKYGGVVIDNDDPQRLARLKVRVPGLMQDAEIGWARPALPFAGPGHGHVMLPELDAMVWVEFEAGNLDQPIWSGCFYAENQSAPTPGAPGGRVIVTPQGHSVVLDDDGDKLVVMHSGGAKLEMTATGLTLSIGASKMVMSNTAISFNDGVLKIGPAGVSLANGAMTLGVPPT